MFDAFMATIGTLGIIASILAKLKPAGPDGQTDVRTAF